MVIKAIETIAEDQGFKSLKFKNRKGAIFHDADWIVGVDYDENIQQDADGDETYEDNENRDQEQDEEIDEEFWINEEEIKDLFKEQREQANPNQHCKDEGQGKMKLKKKKNRRTTRMQPFWNKKPTHREVNLEDPQGRAGPYRDSNLT
jgi:hypothetical protein